MDGPFLGGGPTNIAHKRKLVPIRATAVEVVAGDDPHAIEVICDSELALYRFRIDNINAAITGGTIVSIVARKLADQILKGDMNVK